jgi:PAS domain S-box-containing protein
MTTRTPQPSSGHASNHGGAGDGAEHDRNLAQRYLTLTDSMPQMVWATDADGSHFYYNRRWYEYTGLSEEQSLGFGFANALHPDDRERTLAYWQRAWRDGESYEIEYRFRRYDGAYRWFIGRANPVRDASGTIVEWVGTCTDIDDQKRDNEILQFLVEASTLLTASLDYQATLAQLANLAVPRMADWCAIDILEDGRLRRLAVAHADPAKVALAHELEQIAPPFDPDAPRGVAAVLRTGEPEMLPVIDEDLIRASIDDPQLLSAMLTLGLRSSMTVPLRTRDATIGAITLVAAESGRHFTQTDLRLALELAHRAASAIENAQLYRDLLQFRITLDQTRDCVLMFDPATLRFIYVNQGAVNQLGYSRSELLRMTPPDIKPELDEQGYRAMIQPLLDGELSSYTLEAVHRHKDGHLLPVEVSLQYVMHPGTPGRFVTVVRDISERKRAEQELRASEQRYRHLADAMPMHVWLTDLQGRGTYYNQRWLEYTGLTLDEATRDGGMHLIHPDDRESTIARWGESLRSGAPFEAEYRLRGTDSEYRWFLNRALPYRSEGDQLSYWVSTSTDIQEQKQAQKMLHDRGQELERLTTELADRNRELDQFAYITSHDLKAPLRGIANLSQWIEEDLGARASDEVRSYLDLLKGRVLRMEALIDGILQYSRVGRSGGGQEPTDVGALLDDIVDLLAPPKTVTIEVAPGMPTITTQRLPLSQVFSNLISNAIKHNSDQNVHISVTAQNEGSHIHFTVRDNGQGIASEYHERIFGIFQTLASRDRVEGSGLGLALVKKIVEHHRGRVWLESQEGQGAAFHFTWPNH